jgi:hypothetical protein
VSAQLTLSEGARLAELEQLVERGLQTFIDVGNALQEIRDERLYRATHQTFADYCRDRFGFSDSRGRQLIAAAKTVTEINALGLPAPRSETEAREAARALRDGNLDAILARSEREPSDPSSSRPTWSSPGLWASPKVLSELRGGNPTGTSEKQFMGAVVEAARLCGWLVYHPFDSRRSQAGFPDLVCVRERVLFCELKSAKGKLSEAQADWLASLASAGASVHVWTPEDWSAIEETLR